MVVNLHEAKFRSRRQRAYRRGATPGASIGVTARHTPELVARVLAGLPYRSLETFQRTSGLPLESIVRFAGIPRRTLSRRKTSGRLTPDESERLLRASTVFEMAVNLFDGNVAEATRWLQSPQRALGGPTPLEFARTEVGSREVENLIGRLEHGVIM